MSDIQKLEIDLDLKENLLVTATCKQLDNLNLILNIWDNGQVANLNNYTCRLKALKQDQVPLIQNTDISIDSNIVTIKASEQLTTTSGIVKTELQFINNNGEKKSTFNLNLRVISSTLEVDRTISKATCTLLEELDKKLDQIEDIKLNIEEGKEVNNALKTTTNNANLKKREVENIIDSASSKIKEVEISTKNASTVKSELDTSKVNADNSRTVLESTNSKSIINKENLDKSNVQAEKNINALNAFGDAADLTKKVNTLENKVLNNEMLPLTTDSTLTKLNNCAGGFVRNMRIRGKTLQNVKLTSGYFEKTFPSGTHQIYYNFFLQKDEMLAKPNTEYTIVVDFESVINEGEIAFGKTHATVDPCFFTSLVNISTSSLGRKVFKLTTVSDLSTATIAMRNFVNVGTDNTTAKGTLKFRYMILEGDYTNKEIPPYFEGIKSVGEAEGNKISILTTTKNLLYNNNWTKEMPRKTFKNNTWMLNAISNSDIVNTNELKFSTTDKYNGLFYNITNLKLGTKYTLSFYIKSDAQNKKALLGFNNSKQITYNLSNEYTKVVITEIAVKETENFIFYNANESDPCDIYIKDVQLEEGETATAYKEYKEDKTTISLSSPHCGLPNGVSDIVDFDKNQRIKNVGKVVFDGSDDENWLISNSDNNMFIVRLKLNNVNTIALGSKNFASNYPLGSDNRWNVSEFENNYPIGVNTTNADNCITFIVSRKRIPSINSLETWKDYLKNNNMEFYYQLAEPVIEKLNIKDTLQTFTDGYIQLDNVITPSASLEYSTNLPSMINKSTEIVDKLVDEVANVESTITDMDAEIDEARKGKTTINERLEDDKKEILNKVGELNKNKIDKNEIWLPDKTDFNQIIDVGKYRANTWGNNPNLPEHPLGKTAQGTLEVEKTQTGIIQTCKLEKNGMICVFIRSKYQNENWTKWNQLTTVDDTGWIPLPLTGGAIPYNEYGTPYYRKVNGYVEIRGSIKGITNFNDYESVIFATLPLGFRSWRDFIVLCQGSNKDTWVLQVDSGGYLKGSRYGNGQIATKMDGTEWLTFHVVYYGY